MSVSSLIARPAVGVLLGAATAIIAPVAPTSAQSACGASYSVRPGDTLSKIAARCGTTVSALTRANAFIRDPARIEIGWTLAMPGAGGYQPPPVAAAPAYPAYPAYPAAPAPTVAYPTTAAAPDPYLNGYGGGSYAVQPGDSFGAIAQALGVSLAALLSENSSADPGRLLVGQLLQLPGGAAAGRRYDSRYDSRNDDRWYDDDRDRPARLRLEPSSGRPGSQVEIRVDRLDRRERLALGVRDGRGGIVKLAEARADGKGKVKTKVRVPEWADSRDELIFVVRRQDGEVLRSQPFDVTRRRADRRRGDGRLERPRRSGTIEGWVVRGVECPVLRTTDGTSYSLVSNDVRLPLGAYVQLTGKPVRVSKCMEGAGTIDVSQLRRVNPPR